MVILSSWLAIVLFPFQAKEMEHRLALKSKSATDLETKVKSLKSEATAKNKQMKELEKEVS